MEYRGVIDENGILIAFGRDEDQSGPYHETGTWCDFTFTSFPETSVSLDIHDHKFLFKVVDNEIVARTQEEIDSDV